MSTKIYALGMESEFDPQSAKRAYPGWKSGNSTNVNESIYRLDGNRDIIPGIS